MTSPFNVFRSNLKPLMAGLTLLALVSFVVLPAVQMYLQYRQPTGEKEIVATYSGGSFNADEVYYYQSTLGKTNRFLGTVAEEVVARGGIPDVPNYGPVGGNQMSYGISAVSSPQAVVLTQLFANEAKKLGLELDDTAIDMWLVRFTNNKLSAQELAGIRAQATQNSLGKPQLYSLLRTELLAQIYERVTLAGLASGQTAHIPPLEAWQYFLRLKQQARVQAYPVIVEEFLTSAEEPSAATVDEIYNRGKNLLPNESSPEPAFRRPDAADVEYVYGVLDDFITTEAAKFSEDQLREEFERRNAASEFTMPPLDSAAPESSAPAEGTPQEGQPAAEETPSEETPSEETPSEETPAEETAAEETAAEETPAEETAAEETPSEETPSEETPSEETPSEETPAEETPAEETPAEETPAEETPAEETPATRDDSPAPSDQTNLRASDNGTRLVAAISQDQPPADQPPASEPTPEPAQETPAPEATEEPEQAPAQDTPTASAGTAVEEAPADTPQEGEGTPAGDQEPAEGDKVEEPKKPTFEESKDEIARSLALFPAFQAMDKAIQTALESMRRYGDELAYWKDASKLDPSLEEPTRPDLKTLAESLGLRYEKTGLKSIFDISTMPIGRSRASGGSFGSLLLTPARSTFYTVSTIDDQNPLNRIAYVAWKVEMRESYIPELAEVRDEVVAYAKLETARKLAEEAAKELAEKANADASKPLTELVPEAKKGLVFDSVGPFSWMQSLGEGFPAIPGEVPELDNVGEDFFEVVFVGPLEQFRVAPNNPKSVYYVTKTIELTPQFEELQPQFMQANLRAPIVPMANREKSGLLQGFNARWQEALGLKFDESAED